MPKLKFKFLILILGMMLSAHSQNFNWVKKYGGIGGENNPSCLQTKNGTFLSWMGFYQTSFGILNKSASKGGIACVGKMDKQGKPVWLWTSDSIIGLVKINAIAFDSIKNYIYLAGQIEGEIFIGNGSYSSFYSFSKNKYSRNGFIFQLNKDGVLQRMIVLNDTNYSDITDIKFFSNKLFAAVTISGTPNNFFCGLNTPCYNNSGIIACSLDSNLQIINKSELIKSKNLNLNDVELNQSMGQILLTSYSTNISFDDSIMSYKDTSEGGYFCITLTSNLKVKRIDKLYSGTYFKVSTSVTEKGELIVGTGFADSLTFKNTKIYSDNLIKPIIMFFNREYNLKYSSVPTILGGVNPHSQILALDYHMGFIYTGGRISGDFKFGDIITKENEGSVFISKIDSFGNFLWTSRFFKSKKYNSFDDITAINKSIICVGTFNDTADIGPKQFVSNGGIDMLVLEIHDIEIFRGVVKKGPYCAGDSIIIPFTKDGDFNFGNQFIAQLSDEKGYFNGEERELGRVSSMDDGVINGILPMFNVESSQNYRIRIISTSPIVQSYYKYDTLRLLIYSKDNANPGRDTIICEGQKVNLNTTGGTKWRWSPGIYVDDSTAKNTVAHPIANTHFRIIISDSSGCGEIDTAYKTVFVRNPLKIIGLPQDTIICKNGKVSLKINGSGGVLEGYNYQWINSLDEILRSTDTISMRITLPTTIKAILRDGCSVSVDTGIINFSIPSVINSRIEKPPCFDSIVSVKVNASGGYNNSLNHIWFRDNVPINFGKQITISSINKKQLIKVITTDFCNNSWKDSILIFPNPKARFEIQKDSICQFESINVYNLSKSFSSTNYFLKWTNNQKDWKTNDTTIIINDVGNQMIRLTIKDSIGCSDSSEKVVFIVQSPDANFVINPMIPTVDCGSFALTPTQSDNKRYQWAIGDNLKLTHHFAQQVRLPIFDTITYQTSLIVTNYFGCSDTTVKSLKILESDAFWIPNAVSRNNDGLNDEFAPYGWKIKHYEMLIVSQTDQVVYKGSTPWKPSFEGGVYSYIIKVWFRDGNENVFKGHVHVIY